MVRILAACSALAIYCSNPSATDAGSLADHVNAFNEEVRSKDIGKEQPPLTVAEVVASIRASHREEWLKRGATDADYERFQQVAETGELPQGSVFTHITRYQTKGYLIDVWWVDLYLPAIPGDKIRWTHRIMIGRFHHDS